MTSAPIMTSPRSVSQPIRTLVVDDSVVVRTVIERILNADPHYCVVNKSSSAEQALAFLADNKVDLVLLDIELPGQSGLAALPAIMEAGAGVKVAILSGKCEEGSAAAVEALALGASDILSKPGSGSFGEQFPQALVERLGRLRNWRRRRRLSRSLAWASAHRPAAFTHWGNCSRRWTHRWACRSC